MTLDQFRMLAETWGGDIARWPPATREAARLVAAGEEGRRMLAAQAWLDQALAKAPAIAPDRAARASLAVLQRLAAEPRLPWYRRWLRPAPLVPAASLACSAALGLWLGGVMPEAPPPDDATTAIGLVFDASVGTPWGQP